MRRRPSRESESGGAAQELPSLNALERLDTLRQSVQLLFALQPRRAAVEPAMGTLRRQRHLSQRAAALLRPVSSDHVRRHAGSRCLNGCASCPCKPGPNDDYQPTYDTLEGYLITTSHPEKSTRDFLSPLLMERWLAGRKIDSERRRLAQSQFDFYSEELLHGQSVLERQRSRERLSAPATTSASSTRPWTASTRSCCRRPAARSRP